ncbi:MAG: KpsF/GutQ family sugar-phosphate isomerase [Elusimicrobiota bacterium]
MVTNTKRTLNLARKVLRIEASAVVNLQSKLGAGFIKAVGIISDCEGRVIVTGLGKSGIIARKIAATLAATGTPATYMHPTDGIHGDIGILELQDVVILISYSGETTELAELIPAIKKIGAKVIGITGDNKSTLARISDVVLSNKVTREACPYNIAPTASTTACLALGDALAVCVMSEKKIKPEHFALLHPGGTIGKKLLWTVKDIMRTGENNPVVTLGVNVKSALLVMTRTRVGAVSIVDSKNKLLGYFSDGDLRRCLERMPDLLSKKIDEVMTKNPLAISAEKLAVEAAKLMRERKCDNLPVVDTKKRVIGIIDERDILDQGIV